MMEMVNDLREPQSEVKSLVKECQSLLKQFKGWVARHEYREANQSADHLANLAVYADECEEWYSEPPPSLIPLLQDDFMGRLSPRFPQEQMGFLPERDFESWMSFDIIPMISNAKTPALDILPILLVVVVVQTMSVSRAMDLKAEERWE
uniref:RNase H type-1 domain-containing protein n=1 Tax=Nelumbo nucifera TaxID=4432 RepID=A0A822ZDT4_NELNU|nr:TPA_asm: hypothetical protein HUJ06_014081 [Nelumbo nucifera]DAD39774.1 TPA_asm: hypothetical protein HUJ06_014097 [Nelumbo nucifera]